MGDAIGTAATAQPRETLLTRQVRVLYEQSVVPVAEIARLAGVNERTLYRYVRKGGWRRRYLHDTAAAVIKRAAAWKPRAFVTAKGVGGRFIRAEDVGVPFARGPEGARSGGRGAGAWRWPGARRSCRTRRSGGPSVCARRPSDARIMAHDGGRAARSRGGRGMVEAKARQQEGEAKPAAAALSMAAGR